MHGTTFVRAMGCLFSLGVLVRPSPGIAQVSRIQTRVIDVGGFVMRVQTSGLDERQADKPIVVFEAGATNSLDIWDRVLREVAGIAPVVAYDRSGLGQSTWDQQDPTPAHVAERLRALLATIGADPPYVLVGFSWGGALVRYFAGFHPETVAGVVYVDPGPIVTQTRAQELAPFEAIGAGEAGFRAYWQTFEAILGQRSPAIQAEFRILRGLMDRELDDRGLLPAPRVPVVVIVAGKYQPLPLDLPYDARAHFDADLRHRIKLLTEWTLDSPHGELVVTNTTGHVVPMEAPDLVRWAVQRVLSHTSSR